LDSRWETDWVHLLGAELGAGLGPTLGESLPFVGETLGLLGALSPVMNGGTTGRIHGEELQDPRRVGAGTNAWSLLGVPRPNTWR
jgi:hypothetical protein